MTASFRLLLWAAVLVGWSVLVLDWRDEVVKLRPERASFEQLRLKEQSALVNADWQSRLQDAKIAQAQWLSRLPRVEQTGVFRAQALETIADLCKQISAACQVGALGENATAPTKAGEDGLSGLISTGVRVTIPIRGKQLELLMKALENDTVLRRIEKITVRNISATFDVQTFGISPVVPRSPSADATARTESRS